ncbi:toll/interleukin-1 receptor domain-containing protein [Nocardia asteroides]|uniref:toll/interleukin-1 receptor domain-containing protein n=1 Tax=Nocardia asteroides TaxID=1824 RepID=UPI001E368B58|nr:toll/interleukin-1 receptor domain-containing protein [Nocardia asteroides]UGT60149.1 toll/interleukin-1 receptor domain-containing protein [Nocardia asteroides]
MTTSYSVFCSYAAPDRDRVLPFIERLRADGVDATFDYWEVQPGDDIVAWMSAGIDRSSAALIFVSQNWAKGTWVMDEFTSLIFRRVTDRLRVIPILLERDLKLPAAIAKLAHRTLDDYDQVRATLRP